MTETSLIVEGEFAVFCTNYCERPIGICDCCVNGAQMPYNSILLNKSGDGVMVTLSQSPLRTEIFFVPMHTGFYEERMDGSITVGTKDPDGLIVNSFTAKIV